MGLGAVYVEAGDPADVVKLSDVDETINRRFKRNARW